MTSHIDQSEAIEFRSLGDPLGSDWKARGERGTAVLREMSIEDSAGKLLPIDGVETILRDLASTASGMLAAIGDRCRALGATDAMVGQIMEVVADVQVQISVALDGVAEAAAHVVETHEASLIDQSAPVGDAPDIRGPKERKASRQHKGKPTLGNAKPKVRRKP